MRKAGYLKPNKARQIERYWLFFDTEAYIIQDTPTRQRHVFRLGHAKYFALDNNLNPTRMKEARLNTREDIGEFVLSVLHSGKTLHVVAHNIGYDLQITGLLEYLASKGFVVAFIYLKEPTVIIKLHKDKLRISLEDGYNRLRGSIEEWGRYLGLPKGKVDFANVDDEALYQYCKRDVDILANATLEYLRFIKTHDLGCVKYTISSQALAAYRHRFMPLKIQIHDKEEVLALEREAYGGGMVRLFHKGHFEHDTYYLLDVNSMYAYVMKNYQYPYRLIAYAKGVDIGYIEKYLPKYAMIAKCRVKPKRALFRCRHLGKITYPLCEFVGTFTTEELAILVEDRAILEVLEVAVYKKAPLFTNYVEYFWGIREEAIKQGNPILKAMAKQYLNSLYGKFGARATSWVVCEELVGSPDKPDMITNLATGDKSIVLWIGDTPYRQVAEEETEYSIPAIAAHVTANARVTLWGYVELAGYDNVYYTDTDSLIVNSEGYRRLLPHVSPTELGKLKLEKEANSLTLFARKDYMLGDKIVCKGVNGAFLVPGAVEYKREQWRSLRRYLRSLGQPEVLVELKELELKRGCYDGVIAENGQVLPFTELPTKWG